MGGELVEDSSSPPPPPVSISQILDDWCPIYLSWGMPSDEYWHGDPWLAKHYRKAQEMREKRENLFAHRQGRYFYDALYANLAFVNAFLGAKPLPYVDPYPVTDEDEQELMKKRAQQAADKFTAWSTQFNKERGG